MLNCLTLGYQTWFKTLLTGLIYDIATFFTMQSILRLYIKCVTFGTLDMVKVLVKILLSSQLVTCKYNDNSLKTFISST